MALVVDDSTVNRRILARLLQSAGARVITAAGGQEALRLTREHRPDVIFMDIRMSDINGLDVTRQLKADPLTAGIPVIAVTASAFGASREAAKDAGCIDYLSKPVRAESLYAALHAHLGVQFVSTAAPEAPADPELSEQLAPPAAGLASAGGRGHRQRHRPRGAGAGTGGRGCRRGGARPAHCADDGTVRLRWPDGHGPTAGGGEERVECS